MADAAAAQLLSESQFNGTGAPLSAHATATGDEREEQEIVAVGAVAHVVRRAFHQFYSEDVVRSSVIAHDQAVVVQLEQESDQQYAVGSTATAGSQSSTPRTDAPTAAIEGAPHDDTESADMQNVVAAEPEVINPFVLLGETRKAQIQSELRCKRDDALALLQFLDQRHREAKEADDAIAQELSDKGLVIKAQIPMGPSNLRLSQEEVERYGAFAHNLVHATQLVSEYHARRREKSGNGPGGLKQRSMALRPASSELTGYLESTDPSTIRTQSTLRMHQSHIESVKTHHETVKGSTGDATALPSSSSSPLSETQSTEGTSGTTTSQDLIDAAGTGHSEESKAQASNVHVTMGAVEKRKNMEILARMQTKLDFLRNPRYVTGDDEQKSNNSTHDHAAKKKKRGLGDQGTSDTNPDANASSGASGDSPHSSACFVIVPSKVEFTGYDIGGVYEQLVYLRNTSHLSRPRSRSRTRAASSPPGMHVQIRLRFAPDSRADYKDVLQVLYEGTHAGQKEGFVVPLAAHRTPPELSIPLVLKAQNTLVGMYSTMLLPCRNTGGKARFWLMTEEVWARYELNANQFLLCRDQSDPSLLAQNSVKVGPFTLSPNEMELDTGESVTLQLQYVPSCIGEQREKFVMVCDNCLVRVFQVVGRGCQVEMSITQVNDKPQIDTGISHMGVVDRLGFPDLVVSAHAQQRFVVSNDTPIDLTFAWHLAPLVDTGGGAKSVVVQPPYEIRPASGVISLNGAIEFTVDFVPTQARVYAWRAMLLINDIPKCSMPGPEQRMLLMQTFQSLSASLANVELQAVPCLQVRLDGAGMLGSFSIAPSYWNFCNSAVGIGGEQQQLLQKHETYTTRVQLVNNSHTLVAFEIDLANLKQRHLKPAATTAAASGMGNTTQSPAFDLAVSPMSGEIGAQAQIGLNVAFTPHCVGAFSLAVPCRIPTTSTTTTSPRRTTDNFMTSGNNFVRWLLLEGRVASGKVEILSPEVDFGLVLVGASAEATLTFCNRSSVASAEWRFAHLEAAGTTTASSSPSDARSMSISSHAGGALPLVPLSTTRQLHRSSSKDSIVSRRSVGSTSSGNDTSRSSNFLFTARDTLPRVTVMFVPENGSLAPGETTSIKVLCLAGSLPERFRASFCCQLSPERLFSSGGMPVPLPTVGVSARAEIQSPNVFMSPSKLHLGTTYLGVTVRRTLQLINVSNLETSFKFVEPQGASKGYSVDFAPKSGTIRSKETLAVSLIYTPRHAGKTTVLLACTVRGLTAPLGVEVSTNQKGLVLSYELLPPSSSANTNAPGPLLPKSPKEIALERGISIADCDLEPETNPLSAVPKLLFGDDIPLGERKVVRVLVRNFSGIEAVVDLEAKKFPAKVSVLPSSNNNNTPTSPSTTQSSKTTTNSKLKAASSLSTASFKTRTSKISSSSSTSSTSQSSAARKKLLLADAHEQPNRFQSENGRDYVRQRAEDLEDREILSRGHGVAFQLTPSHLKIPPWEQAMITCVCFNNMPGSYADDIVSRAVGVPPVFLHAQATVVGTPLMLDRNCVGLYFHKNKMSGSQQQPSFHFGQLCVRSPPLTRTIRVINRGPKQAKLKWKLVENGCENQLVNVTLRVAFGAKVQLRIAACAEDGVAFPFEVQPEQTVIPPFATVPFQITFTPPPVSPSSSESMALQSPRVLLLADAYWYELETPAKDEEDGVDFQCPELSDPSHSSSSSGDTVLIGEDPTRDSRCESTSPKHKHKKSKHAHSSNHTAAAAAGKAFAAVRAANSLSRRVVPLGLTNATPSPVSSKCLRVQLAADVIEPELFLDRSIENHDRDLKPKDTTSSLSALPMSSSLYHIKFTTWSTIAENPSEDGVAHVFHHKELFLVNHFSTRLTFRLESVGPFLVFRADSIAPKHPLSSAELPPAHRRAQGETFMFTLPPQMSVRIDLRFDPSQVNTVLLSGAGTGTGPSSLLQKPPNRGIITDSSSASSLARKQQQQQQRETQRRLKAQVDGQLLIKFTHRSVQTVNLVTEILRPLVVVSPSVYFFGHVHLSKQRSVVLRIANPSVVPAAFSIQHVSAPVPISKAQKQEFKLHHVHYVDEPSVFMFSTMKGVVRGPTTSLRSAGGVSLPGTDSTRDLGANHLVFDPVEVVVVFKASATRKRFKSRFRFAVAHGLDFEVVLEGEGHLSEQEIEDQDRSIVRTSTLEHSHQIFKKILR